ncbi:hypothetical protein JCM10207_007704 [Rhodosporidiobolus poonsookiae]
MSPPNRFAPSDGPPPLYDKTVERPHPPSPHGSDTVLVASARPTGATPPLLIPQSPPPYPRQPSPPPLTARATAPALCVDVKYLPCLMHFETLTGRFIRWYDPQLPLRNISFAAEPPPWSRWLESYYRMYRPETWKILDSDHEADKRYHEELRAWRGERLAEEADQQELDQIDTDLETVSTRLFDRFSKLYALHYVREQHRHGNRWGRPLSGEGDVLMRDLDGEDLPMCQFGEQSVWPLPCAFPPGHGTGFPTTLTCLAYKRESTLLPYMVPGVDSLFLRSLHPGSRSDDPPPFDS